MIKGISSINNIAKAGVVTALLMGAAAMNATNPIKSANQNQTEVVSKEGAQALKAMNVDDRYYKSSDMRNQRIENLLKKVVHTPEDEKRVGEVIDYVNESGLYQASALMQHEIDCQMFELFITGNTDVIINKGINPELGKKIKSFGPDFFKTVLPVKDDVFEWQSESYSPFILALLKPESKKPSARDVNMKINYIIEKNGAGRRQRND